MWTAKRIYILGEIVDDILFDSHRDPLVQYWDDDCLEIFIDEDHSGGDHQYNHNAFAYHMSLDNQAIDIGTDKQPHSYSHHVAEPLAAARQQDRLGAGDRRLHGRLRGRFRQERAGEAIRGQGDGADDRLV